MKQIDYVTASLTSSAWFVVIALVAIGIEYGLRKLVRRAHISKELHFVLRTSSLALAFLDCAIVIHGALEHFRPLARLLG